MRKASLPSSSKAAAACLAGLWWGPTAFAHHSFAMFDAQKSVTTDATVQEFQWGSPHTWLNVLVPGEAGADGKPFSLELNAVSGLVRNGWKPSTLTAGDKITVTYHPMRDGTAAGQLMEITLKDGRTLKGQ